MSSLKSKTMNNIKVINENEDYANCIIYEDFGTTIMFDAGQSLEVLKELNLKIDAIFLTHGHYDHVAHLDEIVNYFKIPVYLSKECYNSLQYTCINLSKFYGIDYQTRLQDTSFNFLSDGQMLEFNSLKIKVLSLKGHTSCSLGFIFNDTLIAGDAVFENSIGRYDLPTGNAKESLNSLNKIFNEKNINIIYPGHGKEFTGDEFKKKYEYYKSLIII